MDEQFLSLLRERSRELCPDYPNIQKDLEPWEHLRALTASLEGTILANEDCHKFINHLRSKLGWTKEQVVEDWLKMKAEERNG